MMFRDIPNIPGFQISDSGIVRNSQTNRVLAIRKCDDGYMRITIRRKPYLVHQLIMCAFVGPNPQNCTIDHIDRNRQNNALLNLRYATLSMQRKNSCRKDNYNCLIPVQRIDSTGEVEIYKSVPIAAKALPDDKNAVLTKVRQIYAVMNTGKMYKGYIWKRLEDELSWREIPHNLINGVGYAVSENGYIKFPNGRYTFGSLHASGYYIVNINKKTFRVHVLIAEVYLQRPTDFVTVVNHKNGVKNDNRLENLEFITPSENTKHAYNLGLIKKNCKSVSKYTKEGIFLETFSSILEAAASVNKHYSNIVACCQGRQITSYGYIWKYTK